MALVGVRGLAANVARQGTHADQYAQHIDLPLMIRAEREHLPVPLQQGGEQHLGQCLAIMEVEVP